MNQSIKRILVFSVFAFSSVAPRVNAQLFTESTPGIPNVFKDDKTAFQNQTHFLVFLGSDTGGENARTANAYYNTIDPGKKKRTFTAWLKNAGFISSENQWNSIGPQIIACDLGKAAGCDVPKHNPDGSLRYGPNIVNTDAHFIWLNAADLGFVRNQFIRCVPSCSAPNPIIYTYLENYPVNPFAAHGNGGSGFPIFTGYPTEAEASAAIKSALNRPSGNLGTCDPKNPNDFDTVLGCSIQRIADVAFEWAPPASNPSSSTRFGQLYAFIFQGVNVETIANPKAGVTPNVATGLLEPFNVGDPFPPNLDFIGNKQHPGVCFICHGGRPPRFAGNIYPNEGNVDGFRFLPVDLRNGLFTSDLGPDQPSINGSLAFTDRFHQEAQIKAYNEAVLLTVPTTKENDGTGATRVAHIREIIEGWYAGGRMTQDVEFIPVGWREPVNGGAAPPGSEDLYKTVVSPSCRGCHLNREVSLDFGTAANFKQESDLLQLALLPDCSVLRPGVYHADPNAKFMPLAHLTYQRYWEANHNVKVLPFPENPNPPGPLNLFNTAEKLASYFGFNGVSGYCATNP